ncbi:MAG: FAD-binding protein [Rhodospirillaceae bacterium]|jgi:succinate dehydrogenase/fumarate reductase flavoprotein subunit|nr:FAD-binding protein [Rhodospirillaceae bacterium]
MAIAEIGTVRPADVLIIGGGLAGLFAAIKAKEAGAEDVLIIDKGAVGLTNRYQFSGGYTIFLLPDDDGDQWLRGFVAGQQGMCPQNKIEKILSQSAARLADLEQMGLIFPKESGNGGYRRIPSRGLGPVKTLCPPTFKNLAGGPAVTAALLKKVRSLGVKFQEKTFVSDLIVSDGQVSGAVGCHRRSGEFFIFPAKAVVIAGGDCSFRGNYVGVEQVTGDTFAIAHRAGADLANMEFLICNTGPTDFGLRGTGPLAKNGAVFRNAKGEDFLKKYADAGSRAECSDIVQGMAQEVRAGGGPPFYFDLTPTPDDTEAHFLAEGGWMARSLTRLKERDTTVFDREIEWVPVIQTLRGGMQTNASCLSNIDGLFAAGTANSTGPGLFTGWSSAKCIWSGTTAGISAAHFANDTAPDLPEAEQIHDLKSGLFNRPVDPGFGDVTLADVTRRMQQILFAFDTSILKQEERLMKAEMNLVELKDDQLGRTKVAGFHDFIRFKETENMFLTAELFLKASQLRRESRADHRREEYPNRDDAEWLKWIIFNRQLKEGYRLAEFPWDKYKYGADELIAIEETTA